MPAVFHWVRAAQHSSSGVANVGPIATDSCLPPSLCLLHALSRLPFSPHLLHCAVSFFLQSLAKCPGIPHTKQFPFLGPFLKSLVSLHRALMKVLQPFPQLRKVRCRVEAFLYNKTFIPHWQTIVMSKLWLDLNISHF